MSGSGREAVPPTARPRAGPASSDRGRETFTREELDAAEPEVPPSARARALLGIGIGFLAFALGWPVSLVAVVALPLAWTWSGAGVLVGFGAPAVVEAAIAWLDPPPEADAGTFLVLIPVTGFAIGCLAVGVAAMAVRLLLGRRGTVVDERAVHRPRSPRGGPG